jgi:integrase
VAWIQKRTLKRGGQSYRVYWRDPAGNVHAKTFGRERPAQAFAREVESRKDQGLYVDPAAGRVTVGEFFEHFLATASNLRPSTRAWYETLGRLYIVPGLGERPLNAVARADVATFLAGLDRGAATVASVRRILHRMFEVAVQEDRIGRNPAHGLKVASAPPRAPRFLTEHEVARIAAETPDKFRALVFFLAYTGLRIGEATALRVRNVDLALGIVRVVESSPEVAGVKLEAQPTKTSRARAVVIGPRMVDVLRAHLTTFGTALDPASLVFTAPEGGPIRQNTFRRRVFQPAAARAGIEPAPTVHDLRHTAASLMARGGWSMREAGEQLGHSHATMTAHYTHLYADDREARVRRLDDRMVLEVPDAAVAALRG